ncbi:hypothetical protein [uncultured Sphaerochaeta sp.]|uniref:hypothetical protein n=1 Tax=uncultured Sphaerochaeta sp. TaxID=886478 RepID=UPI002A0A2DF2|nr:hypothetical protein [uncultured Sphaerochaeta sp.]
MKKRILAVLVFCSIVSFSLNARSLYDVSLGFGAAYSGSWGSGYFDEMSDTTNWTVGGELSVRVGFLQTQAMIFPVQCGATGEGALLIGFAGINTPILGNLLHFEFGLGASAMYVLADNGGTTSHYKLADESVSSTADITFWEAVQQSPMYVMVGFGTDFGSVGIRVRYLMESSLTLNDFLDSPAKWNVFIIQKNTLSLALSLKMF